MLDGMNTTNDAEKCCQSYASDECNVLLNDEVSELRPAYGMMTLVFKVNARRVGNWATPDSAWNDR